jgi:hypothetical protein
MLFDLRGSGRRTTIKIVYLTLAVLMGGGLVLFGIGGDLSGGLVDAITQGGGSNGNERFEEREAQAARQTRARPQDPEAWATLTRARYQLAGTEIDQNTGQFSDKGKAQLQRASDSWQRYLELDPKKPDDSLASLMVQAYSPAALNKPVEMVRAQEIVVEARPTSATFANLAVMAYQAGQTRKGDLARGRALEEADKDERNALKAQLDQAKAQAGAAAAGAGTGPSATGE